MVSPWIIVDEREGVGRVDSWSEYLCVSPLDAQEKFEIGIFRHEVVDEIPSDWFDDEGDPLPEFSDENGSFVVPEFYEGRAGVTKLTGHGGGYLLGDLLWDESTIPPITVRLNDPAEISQAIKNLGWSMVDEHTLIHVILQAFSRSPSLQSPKA